MTKTITIKLTSSVSFLSLPTTIYDVYKLQIKKCSFRFKNTGDFLLTIKIDKFEDKMYYDGINTFPYTFNLFSHGNADNGIDYFNNTLNPDVLISRPFDVSRLNFNILINGKTTDTITTDNPLFLEINLN